VRDGRWETVETVEGRVGNVVQAWGWYDVR
jgi:hypothetical protein